MLYERQLVAAALALLATVAVLAAEAVRHPPVPLPTPLGSYRGRAGTAPALAGAGPTPCGVTLVASTEGIENAVLPCGERLYLRYGGRTVLASVIGRGPAAPGWEFGLTSALAHRLGLRGVHEVAWSYASDGTG